MGRAREGHFDFRQIRHIQIHQIRQHVITRHGLNTDAAYVVLLQLVRHILIPNPFQQGHRHSHIV